AAKSRSLERRPSLPTATLRSGPPGLASPRRRWANVLPRARARSSVRSTAATPRMSYSRNTCRGMFMVGRSVSGGDAWALDLARPSGERKGKTCAARTLSGPERSLQTALGSMEGLVNTLNDRPTTSAPLVPVDPARRALEVRIEQAKNRLVQDLNRA